MFFRPAYYLGGYYLSLLLFGGFGLALNLFCVLLSWLPVTPARERFFQRLIHRHFALFVWWMRFTRLLQVRYSGLEHLFRGGCVLAVNHPGLMDITYLLARIPEAVCIFKPAIRRNPVLGAAAGRAGYICNQGGPDLVREAADKVVAGNRLIIFPEGTRTSPGEVIGAFRPGFVLIAQRARAPVQLVRIDWNSNVLVKGRAWWKLPRLPGTVQVTIGPCLPVPPNVSSQEIARQAEAWFRGPPAGPMLA